ncbi:MAG TPA: RDD family protein [Tessaracoccus flavescens]|uniref:RDD family protein n=1 Tax=Tessaracoccus flavescens TaxID=399497 RepID=A0A921ELV2_9ACTN|nr:RDD family protein [Tessaracoccus flavescens]
MTRVIPRGAVVAGLGRRVGAGIVDALPLLALFGIVVLLLNIVQTSAGAVIVTLVGVALAVAFCIYQLWGYGQRGAGIGGIATGVRVVGLRDGEPIGSARALIRQLILVALIVSVVGWILLVVFLIVHERRQGWHDLAVGAVVVEPKFPEQRREEERSPRVTASGLPADGFVGLDRSNYGRFAPDAPAPAWLPGLPSETVPKGAAESESTPEAADSASEPNPWKPVPPAEQAPFPGPTSALSPTFPPPPPPPSVQPLPAGKSWIPLPTPTSVIEPSVKVRKREFGEVVDTDGTRIAHLPISGERAGDEDWYVRLDDGREVELSVTVLLGRNPQRTDDDPDEVHLVPASGDGRMISRTHVLIGADLRGVYIVDRGSTNGTALVTPSGELDPAPEGTQVRVREGQQVSYGNRWFTVLRRPEKSS